MDPTPAIDLTGLLQGMGGGGAGTVMALLAFYGIQTLRDKLAAPPADAKAESAHLPVPNGWTEHHRKGEELHAAIVGTVDSRPLFDRLDTLRSSQDAHTVSVASLAASVNRLADQVGDLAKAQRGPE